MSLLSWLEEVNGNRRDGCPEIPDKDFVLSSTLRITTGTMMDWEAIEKEDCSRVSNPLR